MEGKKSKIERAKRSKITVEGQEEMVVKMDEESMQEYGRSHRPFSEADGLECSEGGSWPLTDVRECPATAPSCAGVMGRMPSPIRPGEGVLF